jgi:hypothetical protein
MQQDIQGIVTNPRGELDLEHFDRAIFEALKADFLPFPNPNNVAVLGSPIRQAHIKGVTGPGIMEADDTATRVPVVFDYPEDPYVRYLLPGIRIKRSESINIDDQRRTPIRAGRKYRVPADSATEVTYGGKVGYSKYVMRNHAIPITLTYDIEIRSRYEKEAQLMRKYVRRCLPDKEFLKVFDTIDEPSYFTIFREGDSDIKSIIDSLNRYHGYMLTYRVEAEQDDYEEYEESSVIKMPITRLNSR